MATVHCVGFAVKDHVVFCTDCPSHWLPFGTNIFSVLILNAVTTRSKLCSVFYTSLYLIKFKDFDNNRKKFSVVIFFYSFFGRVGNILYFKAIWIILTTFKLQLGTSVQIAFRDETKLKVRGSVSLEKLMRSRTLILRRTNASLIFPSKYGQYLWRKKTIFAENF